MTAELTIFYDSQCPLCVKEMTHLRRLDKQGRIQMEDIFADDFADRFPQISVTAASAILHGIDAQDRLILGLDVTHAAWSLVGRGWLTAPLRWPGIRWIADKCYRQFARNRYAWSRVLTGQARCERCIIPTDHQER